MSDKSRRRWTVRIGILICGMCVGLKESSGQTEPIAPIDEAIGKRPAHLIVLRLSEAMLSAQINRPIDIQAPVRDVILGTPVTGVGRLTGEPVVKLEPSDDRARFKVEFTGTVCSRTVARKGPAVVHGHSITRFTATKCIVYEPGQGFHAEPPKVVAHTQCFTDAIRSTRGGIIGRIVQRRAAEEVAAKSSAVTVIARERATRRVAAAFEKHMEARLDRLNKAVEFQTRLAGLRTREGNRRLIAYTTPNYLEIADSIFLDNAPVGRPELSEINGRGAPIQILVHSSIVPPNVAAALQTIFTNPDESAIVNSLALLPGPLGKEAAAALTALASENKVAVQNTGDWLMVELNAPDVSRLAADGSRLRR